MTEKPFSPNPWDHNGECTFCDEQGYHRADCPWLLALMAQVAAKDEELLKANEKVEALRAEAERLHGFEEAITDAAVVDWIYTDEHRTNPRKAVNDLLVWQQRIALDPAVSKDAFELHERIKALELENHHLRTEKRQQLQLLTTIRHLADDATGIDRSQNDAREPGALGAVQHLIAEFKRRS